jgi:hypothetical protein
MKPDYLSIYTKKITDEINIKKAKKLIEDIKESEYCNSQTGKLLHELYENYENIRMRGWRNSDFLKTNLFVYFECDLCVYCKDKRPIGKVESYCDQSFYLYTWSRSNNAYTDIFNGIIKLYGNPYMYYDRISLIVYEEIAKNVTPHNIMDNYFRTWPRKLFNCIYKNEYDDPFEIIIPLQSNGNERMTFCVNKQYILLFDWAGS